MVEWDVLIVRVDGNGGLGIATLGELREAAGFGKLGRFVLAEIRNGLGAHGLGAYPKWMLDHEQNLDLNQHQQVRVFRLGSPVERLVRAVESPDHAGDQELRDRAASDDADKLRQIRAIVWPE